MTPSESKKSTTDRLQCDECDRIAGSIFSCQKRPSGQCPYIEEWVASQYFLPLMIAAVGAFVTVISAEKWSWRQWVVLLSLATVFGLWAAIREVQLYNSRLHSRLRRTTVGGVNWSVHGTSSGKLLPIQFALGQALAHPLSIVVFSSSYEMKVRVHDIPPNVVTALVRAALIDLLARQLIEVYSYQQYTFKNNQSSPTIEDDFYFVATRNADQLQVIGVLESLIWKTVDSWSEPSRLKQLTEGPTVSDLVRAAVYDYDQRDYLMWLSNLLVRDAEARGLSRSNWRKTEMEWGAAHVTTLQGEQKIAQSLADQLAKMYPYFSQRLDEQFSDAIKTRLARDASG